MDINVGLLNDSFPPTIDGVANATFNYALNIQKNHGKCTVITPKYPLVQDDYPFEVYRYPSIPLGKRVGYRAGNPFSPSTLHDLRKLKMDLMHVHSPFASSLLARQINTPKQRVPVILTYHTKFEVDIKSRAMGSVLQNFMTKMVKRNINSATEIWVVSNGAVESLRLFGYNGPYKVMENGCDFQRKKAPQAAVEEIDKIMRIQPEELVFLFVGRIMWYKKTKIILDALKIAKQAGLKFRMLFVGDGRERPAMEQYTVKQGLNREILFMGAIYDRERLHTLFSRADLFLFPSTYDTSGLVVKEAAASDCPSVLVRGSCAAEGVKDGFSGFLCEESAEDCARVILEVSRNPEKRKEVGFNAGEHVYLSWEDAVAKAYKRYEQILEKWPYPLPCRAK